jgi:pimeloyl-ACP methyl ester carboxylesterase
MPTLRTLLLLSLGLLAIGPAPTAEAQSSPPRCKFADGISSCNMLRNSGDDFRDAFDEDVQMIPNPAVRNGVLEVTVFRRKQDQGKTGLPLAVLNHGSAGLPDSSQQPRDRPVEQAKYFLQRGYLVAAPMRAGFSRSTGPRYFRCDHYDYAMRYQDNIETTIDHFIKTAGADRDNVVVTAQSNGGMVSLAYATKPNKAKLVVNFSGGIDAPNCDWVAGMTEAAKKLGAQSRLPMLWIYSRTDKIFPPAVSVGFFQAYQSNGGKGEFYLFDEGGHGIWNSQPGRNSWSGLLDEKLKAAGLPWEKRG